MKTTVRRALAALFGSAGVLLLLAAGVQGSGTVSSGTASGGEQDAVMHCSNVTIRGTYGLNIQGTRPVPPPLGGGTETIIGVVLRTYDGAGNFTQIDNVKGSVTGIEPDRFGVGTYQVSLNCTAVTRVEPGPGIVIDERMVIVDGGAETRSITASPQGVMVTALGRKIGR